MFGKLLKLIAILVIGILVYNLFLGNDTEKENARKVFGEIKEVGVAVKDLLKSEKEKFDEGKYDDALEKVGSVFAKMKRRAQDIDKKYLDKIDSLEEKRKDLERRLAELEEEEKTIPDSYGNNIKVDSTERKIEKERKKITREMDDLVSETEKLMEEMEKEKVKEKK